MSSTTPCSNVACARSWRSAWARSRSTSRSTLLNAAGRRRALPDASAAVAASCFSQPQPCCSSAGRWQRAPDSCGCPRSSRPCRTDQSLQSLRHRQMRRPRARANLAAPSESPIPVAGPGGVWIATGSMGRPAAARAVRLLDGRVLVAGGGGGESTTSAELYDPVTGPGPPPGHAQAPGRLPGHIAARRQGARRGSTTGADRCHDHGAEVYDPASGTWTATGKMVGRFGGHGHAAGRRQGARDRVYGGAQLYDPDSGTWTATGTMITPRHVDRHSRQPQLKAGGAVRGRGGRAWGVAARRVRDAQRGPRRRHGQRDLPLPCQGDRRMDLRERATGRRRIVGQRGRHRHPRQDRDHRGRPSGLVESLGDGKGLRPWAEEEGLRAMWRPRTDSNRRRRP